MKYFDKGGKTKNIYRKLWHSPGNKDSGEAVNEYNDQYIAHIRTHKTIADVDTNPYFNQQHDSETNPVDNSSFHVAKILFYFCFSVRYFQYLTGISCLCFLGLSRSLMAMELK